MGKREPALGTDKRLASLSIHRETRPRPMKKSKFTDQQFAFALQQAEGGGLFGWMGRHSDHKRLAS